MPVEKITAKLKDSQPVTVDFDVDEKLKDAVKRYGEDIVMSRYRSSLVIDLQAFMRGLLKQNKTPEEIQAAVDAWQPGVKARGKSPAEKARDLFSKMSPEERAELLKQYA